MATTIKLAVDENNECYLCPLFDDNDGCRYEWNSWSGEPLFLNKPDVDCPMHDAPLGTTREFELNDVGTAQWKAEALEFMSHVIGYFQVGNGNKYLKVGDSIHVEIPRIIEGLEHRVEVLELALELMRKDGERLRYKWNGHCCDREDMLDFHAINIYIALAEAELAQQEQGEMK